MTTNRLRPLLASFSIAVLLAVLEAASAGAGSPRLAGSGDLRTLPVQGSLSQTLQRVTSTEEVVWTSWEAAAVASLGDACCFDRTFQKTSCRLEKRNQSWGTRSDDLPGSGVLLVLTRWEDGEVSRIRVVGSGCPLDPAGAPLVHLSGVETTESVRWLENQVQDSGTSRRDRSEPLMALAYHDDASAEDALRGLAGAGSPSDVREDAIFWIGQTRGEPGARFLAEVARTDPSPEIREKAVFSLSQSDAPSAAPAIVAVATTDRDPDVRGESLFWLAQSGAEEAERVLLERLDEDPDREVRKRAIFAISQLEDDRGVPILIRIAREPRPSEIRREALFWLGQSEDPRAIDFFAEVLER